jgi:hypothetical protein
MAVVAGLDDGAQLILRGQQYCIANCRITFDTAPEAITSLPFASSRS